ILFVINPISGGKKKTAFNSKVLEVLDLKKFKPTFQQTSRAGHAYELGKMAVEEQYDAVVAVGGDGTINELGAALLGSNIPLGIIVSGSGIGLALFLGIPMNEASAISRLNRFEPAGVDWGIVTCRPLFNLAGLGLDASVSDRFTKHSLRARIG